MSETPYKDYYTRFAEGLKEFFLYPLTGIVYLLAIGLAFIMVFILDTKVSIIVLSAMLILMAAPFLMLILVRFLLKYFDDEGLLKFVYILQNFSTIKEPKASIHYVIVFKNGNKVGEATVKLDKQHKVNSLISFMSDNDELLNLVVTGYDEVPESQLETIELTEGKILITSEEV